MTMPMGTIVRLLGKLKDKKFEGLGRLNNLYRSLKDFPECYLATEECKDLLLNPRSLSYGICRNLKLQIDDAEPMKHVTCRKCRDVFFFSISSKAKCKKCGERMDYRLFYIRSHACRDDGRGVFVSDIVTFVVTDDFLVIPYTSAGTIRLLTDLGVTDTTNLEERTLDLGCQQILYLLKLALCNGSPFTHFVFDSNLSIPPHVCSSEGIFDLSTFMNKESSKSSGIVLELSMQKSTGKFLFAEAKEDFVEFLFCFLSIPLGTIVGTLLNGASTITCMDNLFTSISKMSVGRQLKSQDIKDMLVKPLFGQEYCSKNQLFDLKGVVVEVESCGYRYLSQDPRIKDVLLKQSGLFFCDG